MKSLGWTWIPILCAVAAVAGWAADIIPRMPGPQPAFKVLSVKEQRVNIEQEHDNQLFKVYVITMAADGGTWTIWINQENRVLLQRFSR